MSDAVPAGWSERKISTLGKVVTGSTPSTSVSEYWGGNIPFISPSDFDQGLYVGKTQRSLSEEGAQNARILPKDSVLVTCIGSLGGIAISSQLSVTNQQINAIVVSDKNDSRFTYYNVLFHIRELEKYAGTTTLPIINKSTFEDIVLPVPPLPEQKKIASILSSVDEVIENTQKQIDKLQNLKKAAMNELLTKGIGHTEFKDSKLGRIPKGWKVKLLSEVTDRIGDGIHSTPRYSEAGAYPFVNGNNLVDGRIALFDSTKLVDEGEFQKYGTALGGKTILMSINGTIGNLAYYRGEKVVLGKSAAYITFTDDVDLNFGYQLLDSEAIQSYFKREVTGTTIQNLSLKTIRNTPVPIPPMSEQNAIGNSTRSIDGFLRRVYAKLYKTETLKKSLMQDLLTGRVRVSVQ